MKLKFLMRLIHKVLRMADYTDQPRADMYLPDVLLAMGITLLLAGVGLAVFALWEMLLWAGLLSPLVVGLGIAAVLCWRNQTIHMLSDEEFVYTTFLGTSYQFRFDTIEGARQNNDSITLFVDGRKVHIESMAILSERLADAINRQLEKQAQ